MHLDARAWYFGNGRGLMPLNALEGTLGSSRDAWADKGFGTEGWVFSAEPTLKAKVWKLVMFDAWTVDYLTLDRPAAVTAPYTYEPYRDLVIAFDDVPFERLAGALRRFARGRHGPAFPLRRFTAIPGRCTRGIAAPPSACSWPRSRG